MLKLTKDIKKILPIVLLLIGTTSIGQNLYKVQYNLTLTSPFTGTEITSTEYSIQFRSGASIYNYYNGFTFTNESITTDRDLIVNLPFDPDTILFTASSIAQGNVPCGFPSQNTTPYDPTTDCIFLPIADIGCTIPTSNGNPLIMARIGGLEALNTTNGGNQLTSCDPRTISTINCAVFSMSYKVEYQIGANTSTWTTLLPYARRSSDFEIQASDFSGLDSNNPNLRLRVSYDESNSTISRQILPLNFIQCSPSIVTVSSSNTQCNYSQDGGFIVTFDRPLSASEQLTSVSLRSAGTDNLLDTADDIPNFQFIASTTYTSNQFTWPMPLPSNTYRLSYQSGGANSLEVSDPILINSPPSLEYDINVISEISCFDSQDGEVQITINPNNNDNIGAPPYYYTINNDTDNPIPFTGQTTLVSGLGTNQLQFKVFDSNDCTERE